MNDAILALAMPKNFGVVHIGDMLALPGTQTEQQQKRLPTAASEIIKSIASIVDELLMMAIQKRTEADFIAARADVFPKYFHAVRAVADLARILVPGPVLELLATDSFSEAEAEFRDRGLAAFGTAVRDQAIFTVWTLRKISDLCQRINSEKPVADLKDSDMELLRDFTFHAIGTRFHLDCLIKSMQLDKPMYPEVLEVVIDGLRNAVNAYALARRFLDLRSPVIESDIPPVQWDEEEQSLLDEATLDVFGEPA